MQFNTRWLPLVITLLALGGCTAMMVGGGNSGGYEPPKDKCEDGDTGCKSR